MDMDEATRRRRLFELFNEIGIVQQLATSAFNRVLPEGLHVSHFSVINHLVRLGDGRTPAGIAQAFQVTKPTMTNTLAKLDERGFVDIRPNPEDGRSKLVYLTDAGRAFQQKGIEALGPMLERLMADLDTDALIDLLPSLRVLRAYLDENRDL